MKKIIIENEKKIFSGRHSDVYVGWMKNENSEKVQVAVKKVDLDTILKPHSIEKEIKILKLIKSKDNTDKKNLLKIIDDFRKNEDVAYISPYYEFNLLTLMELKYCEKVMNFDYTLPSTTKITYKNKVKCESVRIFFAKIADALSFLHLDLGIIHRDIKPTNIYFNLSNIEEPLHYPVIGDFGISYFQKLNNDPEEPIDHKFTEICSGVYKAPELCFGVLNYSYEVDVWSLGIILSLLYSKNLVSPLTADITKVSTNLNSESEVNELVLINSIFNVFGTPVLLSSLENDPLYWPEMNSDLHHFKYFNYDKKPRSLIRSLLPLCKSDLILSLFDEMMVYDRSKRATTKYLSSSLSNLL